MLRKNDSVLVKGAAKGRQAISLSLKMITLSTWIDGKTVNSSCQKLFLSRQPCSAR